MSDLINRQDAIDALWKALYEYEDKTEKQFQESEDLDIGEWLLHRIFVQNISDIDRDVILKLPTVEIIRCKDCYFCDYSNFHKSYCCSRFDNFGDGVLLKVDAENDFCSFAEREKVSE